MLALASLIVGLAVANGSLPSKEVVAERVAAAFQRPAKPAKEIQTPTAKAQMPKRAAKVATAQPVAAPAARIDYASLTPLQAFQYQMRPRGPAQVAHAPQCGSSGICIH